MWPIILVVIIVLAAGFWVWWGFVATYHFAAVHSGVLYRDGNRSMREFRNATRKVKVKTVIMLADEKEVQAEPFLSELDFCRGEGISVVRIPIKLGGWPSPDQVEQFLGTVTDKNNQPVLLHCAQGVRRTGMLVAAYQESILGYDDARAKEAMLTFGHSERTVNDVKRFIDTYDPKSRAMTAELPVSSE
jgi:protein tyrosine/serine phosphatase